MTTEPNLSNPLWDFSLAVYRRPGVADACLRLQDRHGVDVNVLFCFCWLTIAEGIDLEKGDVRDLVQDTEAWRDGVVRPLREVRRRMKPGFDGMPDAAVEALRSEVKRLELESERLEQDFLFDRAHDLAARERRDGPPAVRVEHALDLYLGLLGATLKDADHADCRVIIDACQNTASAL